jgi:nicotinic acid mononucleotide adenylyltransferase
MCRAAFGGMPRVTVSDAEYQSWLDAVQDVPLDQQDQVSVGTASLIAYLTRNKQTNNNNANKVNDEGEEEVVEQFSFVMGADTFLDLTAGKWKESARVLDLLQGRLVVLERLTLTTTTTASTCTTTDDDNNAAHADTTADTADHMAAAVALQKAVEAVPGARLLRVENLNNTSSSQVRECHSRPVAEIQEQNMVVPAVLEYMCQHGLYGYGKQDGNVEHECS